MMMMIRLKSFIVVMIYQDLKTLSLGAAGPRELMNNDD